MSVVEVWQGSSPVILGLPHTGTDLPASIHTRLNANGLELADTDWHIHRLYAGLMPDMTTVRAKFHRYVIDANRDPDGISLYPGQNTTGLVPETDFDGEAIWKEGKAPNRADIAARIRDFHALYHAALAAEIDRIKAIHGIVVVYDCHSIDRISLSSSRKTAELQHWHRFRAKLPPDDRAGGLGPRPRRAKDMTAF